MHRMILTFLALLGLAAVLAACNGGGNGAGSGAGNDGGSDTSSAGGGTHTHADGSTHADHGDGGGDAPMGDDHAHDDHAHDEVPLGTAMVGHMEVELAQGHGAVEPGKECHLVVKLPYSDDGASIVRAWIGGEDRTLSYVGRGEYAPSHDDYDIHATAPDPLPDDAQWWVEVEKPDGAKAVGSVDIMR